MAGIELWSIAVAVMIVYVGSALQASIGVGLGLLAAPTLSLMDPAFVPGALVVAVVPLTVGMLVREHEHIDRSGVSWAVVGRFLGVALGAFLLTVTGQRAIAIVVGVSVLIAVLASATGVRFATSTRNLFAAGTASGFTGTVAGVGGPPMALTYQHADPRTLRSTLALFNAVGSAFTVPALALAGVVGRRELWLAALLTPGVLLGLWSGRYAIGALPPAHVRPIVLATCGASAVVLLTRQFA